MPKQSPPSVTPEAHGEQPPAAVADRATDLAVLRTVMGADRSLMAWIRTALSLNSFGFTIYKILQSLQAGGMAMPRDSTPRNVGLLLTGLAAFAMAAGTLEHWGVVRGLKQPHLRTPTVMAFIMSALSVLLFVTILARIF